MKHDDAPLGRVLTRREALAVLGLSGAALLTPGIRRAPPRRGLHSGGPACVVRPEQTEGPYFVEELLQRSDIRSDPATGAVRPGIPLALTLVLSRVGPNGCAPLVGAHVDVWHCDALGVYSDVQDPAADTRGQKFLRGYQLTDVRGEARFATVYPGWYPGRAVHIHFKVRTDPRDQHGFAFNSQLYFDDRLTDRVHQQAPYASKGERRTRNGDDRIYRRGGEQLLLEVLPTEGGYAGTFPVGLQIA